MSINKYVCYCVTEQQFVTTWSPTLPTTCPNNNTHIIDQNSIGVLETITNSKVTISGKDIGSTNGYYLMSGKKIDIGPESITINDTIFDIPTIIYGLKFTSTLEQSGDSISIIVNPYTLIGVITQDIAIGTQILYVSESVINNIIIGMNISVRDSTNTNHLGKVLIIDKNTLMLTVEKQSQNNFNYTETDLLLSLYITKDHYIIGENNKNKIGYGTMAGKFVPAGTNFRLLYKNNSGVAKTFAWSWEQCY
jgi:hypothetical protein